MLLLTAFLGQDDQKIQKHNKEKDGEKVEQGGCAAGSWLGIHE
jgi:hypothetical protein